MPIRDMIIDMEVEMEQHVERYALYDFTDIETQELFVKDLFDLDGRDSVVERIVNNPKVLDCFERLQEMVNVHRHAVLLAYAEADDVPKQFMRDVL